MYELQTPQGTIHYDEHGSGEPLLLLHANPGDPADFDAVLPALAARHRVIRVSWPGYGGAPAPRPPSAATPQLFAALLEGLVEELRLERVHVVGNSIGAWAAVRLALAQPARVRSLVLVAPAGFTAHTWRTRLFCALKGREWITRWLNGLMAFLYLRRRTPVVRAMRHRARTGQCQAVPVAVNAALWRGFTQEAFDLRATAAAVAAPALVVAGRHDPLIRVAEAERAAQALPGACLAVLPCGHAAFAELPETFLALVQPFLARHASPVSVAEPVAPLPLPIAV